MAIGSPDIIAAMLLVLVPLILLLGCYWLLVPLILLLECYWLLVSLIFIAAMLLAIGSPNIHCCNYVGY
jgi:high-affinity Fe2+/Pb2+ permease